MFRFPPDRKKLIWQLLAAKREVAISLQRPFDKLTMKRGLFSSQNQRLSRSQSAETLDTDQADEAQIELFGQKAG